MSTCCKYESRKSKNDGPYNGQRKKANYDLQYTTQNTKD